MIQDISPKLFSNSFSNKPINTNSLVVYFKNGKFLLKIDNENKTINYPLAGNIGLNHQYIYLFSIDEEDFFYTNDETVNVPESFSFCDFHDLRKDYLSPKHYVFAAFTAFQLIEWYEGTKYCGRCGALNENSLTERARVCPCCKKIVYPRINPAVIVGVLNKDKILLTKYRTGIAHNALVAGFTEIGETLEETVAREVMEETGLKIKNIRYYKSQPWGIASDILMGFFCDVDGDDTIKMDETELKYAQWVPKEEVVLQPLEYSLTNEMMKIFKDGLL